MESKDCASKSTLAGFVHIRSMTWHSAYRVLCTDGVEPETQLVSSCGCVQTARLHMRHYLVHTARHSTMRGYIGLATGCDVERDPLGWVSAALALLDRAIDGGALERYSDSAQLLLEERLLVASCIIISVKFHVDNVDLRALAIVRGVSIPEYHFRSACKMNALLERYELRIATEYDLFGCMEKNVASHTARELDRITKSTPLNSGVTDLSRRLVLFFTYALHSMTPSTGGELGTAVAMFVLACVECAGYFKGFGNLEADADVRSLMVVVATHVCRENAPTRVVLSGVFAETTSKEFMVTSSENVYKALHLVAGWPKASGLTS